MEVPELHFDAKAALNSLKIFRVQYFIVILLAGILVLSVCLFLVKPEFGYKAILRIGQTRDQMDTGLGSLSKTMGGDPNPLVLETIDLIQHRFILNPIYNLQVNKHAWIRGVDNTEALGHILLLFRCHNLEYCHDELKLVLNEIDIQFNKSVKKVIDLRKKRLSTLRSNIKVLDFHVNSQKELLKKLGYNSAIETEMQQNLTMLNVMTREADELDVSLVSQKIRTFKLIFSGPTSLSPESPKTLLATVATMFIIFVFCFLHSVLKGIKISFNSKEKSAEEIPEKFPYAS